MTRNSTDIAVMTHQRILVTGGAGFLGSHLCRALLRRGARVICADDLSSGNLGFLDDVAHNPDFTFMKHDIVDPWPSIGAIDAVYNLASPASPRHYQARPVETMMTNVVGTRNVLEIARMQRVPFLQASTSEVYGDPRQHPQRETYRGNVNPTGSRACYNEGKRAAEALCFDYHRQHGVAVKVARIFNTYGPSMAIDDGRAVPSMIAHALRNEPVPVYGDGSQTRSFCYVDDMVTGLVALLRSPAECQGPVNLGNPEEVTILDLAHTIIRLTGSRSTVRFHELPPDDPVRRRPDVTLAYERLGWRPRVGLEEGLKRTIAYVTRILGLVSGATATALEE